MSFGKPERLNTQNKYQIEGEFPPLFILEENMNILMIGDVCSTPGRTLLKEHLPSLVEEFEADFTVINGENLSGGRGITEKNAQEMLNLPVDAITLGNHAWDQIETEEFIDHYPQIVRPLNYPEPCPGRGIAYIEKCGKTVAVTNLIGDALMHGLIPCFYTMNNQYAEIAHNSDILLIDFHAEATAEKIAFGYFMEGKAPAVVGTHTHVQTVDARILEGGTAYITDLGMTGTLNGVIGVRREIVINNSLTKINRRFKQEKSKPWQLNGVCIQVDDDTNRAVAIERIYRIYE